MSDQMILQDIPSAISSQELECGATHSDKLDFQTMPKFGPEAAHANLSARQAKEMGLMMSGTCGQASPGSSISAALHSSLVSRLMQRLEMGGGI